jgi:hypothetical protein
MLSNTSRPTVVISPIPAEINNLTPTILGTVMTYGGDTVSSDPNSSYFTVCPASCAGGNCSCPTSCPEAAVNLSFASGPLGPSMRFDNTANPALIAGDTYCVIVTATDSAGFSESSATNVFTIDTALPGVSETTSEGPGNIETIGGTITDSSTITNVGVVICNSNCTSGCTTAEAAMVNGAAYSLNTSALADGNYCAVVTVTDMAGNTATTSQTFTVTNTTTPAAPTISSPAPGTVVGPGSLVVTGTAPPDSSVTVTVAGVTETTTATSGGTYTATIPGPLANGPTTVSVTDTTSGGTSAPVSAPITVDSAVPAAPMITSPTNGSTVDGGGGLTVTGTAPPGSTVNVTVDGTTVTTTANSGGSFTATFPGPLPSGPTPITATDKNGVGTTSAAATVTVTIAGSTGTGSEKNVTNSASGPAELISGGIGHGCGCRTGSNGFDFGALAGAMLAFSRLTRIRRRRG